MKRIFSLLICLVLVVFNTLTVSAGEVFSGTYTTIEAITQSDVAPRSNTATGSKQKLVYEDSDLILDIIISGTFQYNGLSVSVVSKSITKCVTYHGWTFQQTSFTAAGSSIVLRGKLTHLLYESVDVSVSLACDPNGNLY